MLVEALAGQLLRVMLPSNEEAEVEVPSYMDSFAGRDSWPALVLVYGLRLVWKMLVGQARRNACQSPGARAT
jgi:hypothetical protein